MNYKNVLIRNLKEVSKTKLQKQKYYLSTKHDEFYPYYEVIWLSPDKEGRIQRYSRGGCENVNLDDIYQTWELPNL